jgi:hypothetical protein
MISTNAKFNYRTRLKQDVLPILPFDLLIISVRYRIKRLKQGRLANYEHRNGNNRDTVVAT